ncbi:MAG: nucleotidyl transferase AbiEii/AbiGii toxin family protein [Nitrospirae bacterium]|nr:nucleotidyl transferase AbiEii/AbiGii toxin family protein [Nitrospirota bacterium]
MIEQKFVSLYAREKKVSLLIAERSVVLTYALRIFYDASFSFLALKGGTCLRKVYFEDMARFSLDLDFVKTREELDPPFHSEDLAEPSEAILEVAEIIEGTHYGITFSLSDVYVNAEKNAGGALFSYKHDWNEAVFTMDLSLRALPLLAVVKKPLIVESYFRHLPFEPPKVNCLQLEEVMAEKIRAAYERTKVRDLYDLSFAAKKPFSREKVRLLSVLKCWESRTVFEPASFMEKIEKSQYEMAELQQVVFQTKRVSIKDLIKTLKQEYSFLMNLTEEELKIAQDARKHNEMSLFEEKVMKLKG